MKHFEYLEPGDLREASRWLRDAELDAVVHAGGTDQLDLLKQGLAAPGALVDIKRLPGLGGVERKPGKGLRLGALATLAEIARDPVIREDYRALSEAAERAATPQLRNVATLGGNLCQRPRCWYFREGFDCLRHGGEICYAETGRNRRHCVIGGGPCYIVHPSDPAVALLALDAQVELRRGRRTRRLPLGEFFVPPTLDPRRETVLERGEVLSAVLLPEPQPGAVSAYRKFSRREVWDFALASVAVAWALEGRRIRDARIALGGVAPVPWAEERLAAGLAGRRPDELDPPALCANLLSEAEPLDENAYKITLARNLLRRTLEQLAG